MFEFKEDDRKPLLEMGQLKLSPATIEILGQEEINDLIVRHLYGDFGNQYEVEIIIYEEIINYGEKDIQSNYTLEGNVVFVIIEREMNQSSIKSCKCCNCGTVFLVDRNDMFSSLIGVPVLGEDGEMAFIPTNEGNFGCNLNVCNKCFE
ncbi:MAG: hypothetical protein ABF649_17600 [Bacillus sp. (in: firmicutes)]